MKDRLEVWVQLKRQQQGGGIRKRKRESRENRKRKKGQEDKREQKERRLWLYFPSPLNHLSSIGYRNSTIPYYVSTNRPGGNRNPLFCPHFFSLHVRWGLACIQGSRDPTRPDSVSLAIWKRHTMMWFHSCISATKNTTNLISATTIHHFHSYHPFQGCEPNSHEPWPLPLLPHSKPSSKIDSTCLILQATSLHATCPGHGTAKATHSKPLRLFFTFAVIRCLP